jgi:hypothetical protein
MRVLIFTLYSGKVIPWIKIGSLLITLSSANYTEVVHLHKSYVQIEELLYETIILYYIILYYD